MIVKEHQEDILALNMSRDVLENILSQTRANKEKIRRDPAAYYDEARDRGNISEYYKGLDLEHLTGSALYGGLHDLVKRTHTRQIKYNPTLYLYKWTDLQQDGSLKSIYSGQARDPEEVIAEDHMIALKRLEALEQISSRSGEEAEAREAAMQELERALGFNCEHVVPQSWFGKREPMRGDLHHLFTCEPRCNSIRSNNPYFDFPDYRPELEHRGITQGCGKLESRKFEPEYAKGIVARAVLYFLLRYPKEIDRRNVDIEMLLSWHKDFPVNIYERHRNSAIYELQGNRNPFIDFPGQLQGIDLSQS